MGIGKWNGNLERAREGKRPEGEGQEGVDERRGG